MNLKTWKVLIPLVFILVLVVSGCKKTEIDSIVLEQDSSPTEETTESVSDNSSQEETSEAAGNREAATETVLDDNGSISITSRDSAGNVVAWCHYNASTNITEKYVYEYDEQGKLLRELNYTADGNVIDEFVADNYEHANSFGEINYNIFSDYDIDTDNAFSVTIEELAPLYDKAKDIWDTYGVMVLIADKVCDYTDGAELCLDYEKIQSCLQLIESSLACYPEYFFRDFSGDVCVQLVGTGSTAGLYLGGYEQLLIQIDANCFNSSDGYEDNGYYFCYTLHHEIWHMINEHLMERASDSECPLSEERWNSYNPEGFEYVNGYDNEKEAEIYCTGNNYEYFLSSYACSAPDEDRAMIFGDAMAYYQGYDYIEFTEQVNAKLKYLSNCIRAGFQSDRWADLAPWDYMWNR